MSRTRVHAGLALAAVGAVVLVPCRLRRLGPRPRVRTIRLAEAGIAPDRLEPRSGTGRRDARLPAGLDTVNSDHGTASVALLGGGGRIDGYLNASPGQGNETLAACATAWPPLLATGRPTAGAGLTASELGTIARSGGGRQVTYNGHPLYLFIKDKKPGDVKGQGVTAFGAAWFALTSSGNQASTPVPSSAGGGSSGGGGY